MGDGSGRFSIFVFRFSFLALVSVPQGGKEKKEERKALANVIKVGSEFSIFDFLFSFFPLVSVPLRGKEGGEGREKNEERRKKKSR